MVSDLVLVNGKIVTVDENESVAQAVAVKFGKILAVGSNNEIEALTNKDTKIIDLKGRTVIPGLIESHCHPTGGALNHVIPAINASYEAGVRSIVDIQSRIAERVKTTPKGEWINVRQEDDSKLAEKRHPNRWDLDKVAPDHPVMVTTVGGHFGIVNSKALSIADVTKDSPDPQVGDLTRVGTRLGRAGRYEKDPETGEPTGWIYEGASQFIKPVSEAETATVDQWMEGIKWMGEQFAAVGLTCAFDGGIRYPDCITALQKLRNSGNLPIRMRLDVRYEIMDHFLALGIGSHQGFGDDMLKLNGLKITADGACSGRTAWVAESYLHRPGYYGDPAITREDLNKYVMKGYEKGYRFHCHSNGEQAINLFLDALEEAQAKYPREDPRDRVIHCTVVTPEILERIKKLGALPTTFATYIYYHGDKLLPAFGADRAERMFAFRWYLDAGIKAAAHSDGPGPSPIPPLMGIHGMVNRKTAKGKPFGPSQKVSVMEAIKLYTINAAYHSYEEDVLGSIEPGKYADMVVLGKDILTVPTEEIIDIPIDMTFVGGKIVYEKGGKIVYKNTG